MNTQELHTTKQIAERFGVRAATVRQWVKAGTVPCLRPSRKVIRFDMTAVEAAMRKANAESFGRQD